VNTEAVNLGHRAAHCRPRPWNPNPSGYYLEVVGQLTRDAKREVEAQAREHRRCIVCHEKVGPRSRCHVCGARLHRSGECFKAHACPGRVNADWPLADVLMELDRREQELFDRIVADRIWREAIPGEFYPFLPLRAEVDRVRVFRDPNGVILRAAFLPDGQVLRWLPYLPVVRAQLARDAVETGSNAPGGQLQVLPPSTPPTTT
jgi:hypothetical protein